MWYCHMQEPLNYANDCNNLVGDILDHKPWPSIEKCHIEQSYRDLNLYWKKRISK